MFIALAVGCTSYFYQVPGESGNAFDVAVRRDALERSERSGGLEVDVHYRPGEETIATGISSLAVDVGKFLDEQTGGKIRARIDLYTFLLGRGEEIPEYHFRGHANFIDLVFYRAGEDLLGVDFTRYRLHSVMIHELAHVALENGDWKDRWLKDGLPDYLVGEFCKTSDAREYAAFDNEIDPVVALARTEIKEWGDEDINAVSKLWKSDPKRASSIIEEMTWRYAAAAGLIERWMDAARKNGIEQPVSDLLRRIRKTKARVDWGLTQRLCIEQTGRRPEDFSRVSAQDLEGARKRAWISLSSDAVRERMRALRTIEAVGRPIGASEERLLEVLRRAIDEKSQQQMVLVSLAAKAIASQRSVALKVRSFELLKHAWPDRYLAVLPADTAAAVSVSDRKTGFAALAGILNSPDASYEQQRMANARLQKLTGRSGGWSDTASPAERARAARRWQEIIAAES